MFQTFYWRRYFITGRVGGGKSRFGLRPYRLYTSNRIRRDATAGCIVPRVFRATARASGPRKEPPALGGIDAAHAVRRGCEQRRHACARPKPGTPSPLRTPFAGPDPDPSVQLPCVPANFPAVIASTQENNELHITFAYTRARVYACMRIRLNVCEFVYVCAPVRVCVCVYVNVCQRVCF